VSAQGEQAAAASVQDHLDAFAAAGITDVEVPWRAFCTCLFMGRSPV